MISATDLDALRRPHSVCDDSHYTCPQSPEAWVEAGVVRGKCDCGADTHNAKIDALIASLAMRSEIADK